MKRLFAAALICVAGLTNACASDAGARLSALLKAAPDTAFLMIDVHSANNYFSNKIMLAALKSGTESSDVQQIIALLQRPEPVKLAVSGANDSIAAATLERAFASLKGKTVTAAAVAYVGEKESGEALAAKGREVGVQLIVVPFP